MKVLVVHPGTQHSTHIAKQLHKRKMLYKLVTGLVFSKNSILGKTFSIMPQSIKKTIGNRMIAGVASAKIKTYPVTEYSFLKKAKKAMNKEAVWFERNEVFQKKVSSKMLRNSDVVIGFDTSSWILEKRTQQFGKKFILDVSIAHSVSKNKVYKAIGNQFPNWGFALEQKNQYHLDIEQMEYQHADAIVVASMFTRQTLLDNGVDQHKIFINPYGIDTDLFACKTSFHKQGPVKFVFVGIVDARKGIPLLMDAIKKIPTNNASFSFVGPINNNIEELIKSYKLPNVQVMGKVPHAALAHVMSQHDVFVFPSYFEGFGLVILEAMAAGLPVITTNATAGPDCIEHGKEGFVMECGDGQALYNSINYFIQNPNEIKTMGLAARTKAEQFTWDAYGDRYSAIINTICSNNN